MKVTDLVASFAKPIVEQHGCQLWDVEYVREGSERYLRLYIDKDGGIDIDPILCGLREAVTNEGFIVLDTNMFGKMTFHPSDIEQLIKCMRE